MQSNGANSICFDDDGKEHKATVVSSSLKAAP
jgi:hypothetical protein